MTVPIARAVQGEAPGFDLVAVLLQLLDLVLEVRDQLLSLRALRLIQLHTFAPYIVGVSRPNLSGEAGQHINGKGYM
jgi:hypothetical protein